MLITTKGKGIELLNRALPYPEQMKNIDLDKENAIYFDLPDSDIGRSLVIVKKKEPTSKKYPRKAGLPSKEPLQ